MKATVSFILSHLKSLRDPDAIAGMARYGIVAKKVYGVPTPILCSIAKEIGRNHTLGLQLWKSGVYDARQIASLICDPALVTEEQMERWVLDFDSWAICDGCCSNLFDKTPFAISKARAWSRRKEPFVKRAGFVLMAVLAVHAKELPDSLFASFLPLIEKGAADDRNEVKKGVNWALRQIGKKNAALNRLAMASAQRIHSRATSTARWIASDALRELTSSAVRKRLGMRD
jgi:3-methyladenine DNA glycosylase AlkD